MNRNRGVQVELAVSRIVNLVSSFEKPQIDNRQLTISNKEKAANDKELIIIKNEKDTNKKQSTAIGNQLPVSNCPLSLWGISATIGNLGEAQDVLLAPLKRKGVTIRAEIKKRNRNRIHYSR